MIWLGSFWSRPPGKPSIVSIASWNPPWFAGSTIRELAPEDSAGQRISHASKERWIELYKRVLSERGRIRSACAEVDRLLLANGGNIMLACWCKAGRTRRDGSYSGNFCHRLLAGRLLHRIGYEVEVIDLECPRCGDKLSFDGCFAEDGFVCRRCAPSGEVPQHSGSHR